MIVSEIESHMDLEKIQYEIRVLGDSEAKRLSTATRHLPALEQILTTEDNPSAAVLLLSISELFGSHLEQEVCNCILRLSPTIKKYINPSDVHSYVYFSLLEIPVKAAHSEQSAVALKQLQAVLTKHAARMDEYKNPATIIEFLLEYSESNEKDIARSKILEILQNTHTLSRTDEFDIIDGVPLGQHSLPYLIDSEKPRAMVEVYQLFHSYLAKYKLDGYDCMARWRDGCIPQHYGRYVTSNLAIIQDIEASQTSAAATLLQENGIINFARYPLELLLSQITVENVKQDGSKPDVPSVVIATSEHDIEGKYGCAFSSFIFYRVYLYIFQTFKDSNPIWVTELPLNVDQIAHNVNKPNNSVLFYFLAIHGSPQALSRGYDQRGNPTFLTEENFAPDNHFLGIGNVIPTGYTFLASCATGNVTDGNTCIAQTLAEKTKSRIIAPSASGGIRNLTIQATSTLIESISVSFEGGREYEKTPIPVHLFSENSVSTL